MLVKIEDKIIDLKTITKEEPKIDDSFLFKLTFHVIFYSFRDEKYGSSGRSYLVPTPTAIKGLLMTMLGLKRKDSDYFFNNYEVMVGSFLNLKKVRKINTGIKSMKHKDEFKPIPITKEIIYYNGEIEIYILIDKDNLDLIKAIENKEFIFTPYFGNASFLIDLKKVEKIEKFNQVKLNEEDLIHREFLIEFVTTKKSIKENILEKEYLYVIN